MVSGLGKRVGRAARAAGVAGALVLAGGCAAPAGKRLVIPPEMKARSAKAEQNARPRPYVVRLAEGGRVWEIEMPETSGGYALHVPLAGTGDMPEVLTPADEEMLSEVSPGAAGPEAPAKAVGGAPAPGARPGGASLARGGAATPAAPDLRANARRKSYLGGVARVSEMWNARRYELALIEVVALEKEYPQDARLQSMKGSLYLKLGKASLARAAWEKALTINPEDAGVAEALRQLAADTPE